MNNIPLGDVLKLVGKLDDSQGVDTARERFRRYLLDNVTTLDLARDYIEDCLRNSGDQYNRALQDLTNHIGNFLDFEIVFGRYQGVQGKNGFDGHWKSPVGFHIVIEVKTSEVFPIKAATLVNYVNQMISDKAIPDWDSTLGLYVIGRPDPEIAQIQNAIIAEKWTQQLRIISVDSLLTIAELMAGYDVSHIDVLDILRPSGPKIDPLVDLLTRLSAAPKNEVTLSEPQTTYKLPILPAEIPKLAENKSNSDVQYWLTSVRASDGETADEIITRLVIQEGVYGFGENTPGRKQIKVGDWICFYATTKGVVAHAQIDTLPENKPHHKIKDSEKYPWTFRVKNARAYFDDPLVLTPDIRAQLDAFAKHGSTTSPWAWFVQATRRLTQHDFIFLTHQGQ